VRRRGDCSLGRTTVIDELRCGREFGAGEERNVLYDYPGFPDDIIGYGPPSTSCGGAIAIHNADVEIRLSRISNNISVGGYPAGSAYGGGIYFDSGQLTVCESIVASNVVQGLVGVSGRDSTAGGNAIGGGIYIATGACSVASSAVFGNMVMAADGGLPSLRGGPAGDAHGAGVAVRQGSLDLINSTLSLNRARGGNRYVPVDVLVRLVTYGDPAYGGALSNDGGLVRVVNCTLSGNIAQGGAGDSGLDATNIPTGGTGFGGGIANISGTVSLLKHDSLVESQRASHSQPRFGRRLCQRGL